MAVLQPLKESPNPHLASQIEEMGKEFCRILGTKYLNSWKEKCYTYPLNIEGKSESLEIDYNAERGEVRISITKLTGSGIESQKVYRSLYRGKSGKAVCITFFQGEWCHVLTRAFVNQISAAPKFGYIKDDLLFPKPEPEEVAA